MLAGDLDSAPRPRHARELLERAADGAHEGARPMRLAPAGPRTAPEIVRGIARVDRRTKDLAKRIGRGEIAVIDHRDIDRVAGESLVAAGVAAVVNASASISGRYPNGGPIRIVQAGIPMLDAVGADVMDEIRDGDLVELRDGALWRDGEKIASGRAARGRRDRGAHGGSAGRTIGVELRGFAQNTLEYVEKEAELTFEPLELPDLDGQDPGPARARRRARPRLQARPQDVAAVHPRVPAGADRGRRWCRRAPRRRLHARHHHRRLRLAAPTRALHCGAELIAHERDDGFSPARELLRATGLDVPRRSSRRA